MSLFSPRFSGLPLGGIMKSSEKLPVAENIPELSGNIEGLKMHSFKCVFISESPLSEDDRRIRAWLLHTIATASKHYTRARELVELQNSNDKLRGGSAIFHILDVSEQIENCVAAIYRACMAIRKLGSCQKAQEFCSDNKKTIEELRSIRNQFEHMHSQVTVSEIGCGPISIVFDNEGQSIKFRKLSMDTYSLHALIDGAYRFVASLYPTFNVDSLIEAGGPFKVTMTASVSIADTDRNRGQSD